jgi:hypothetical protein
MTNFKCIKCKEEFYSQYGKNKKLCRKCSIHERNIKRRAKNKEKRNNHLCLNCGKRVEPKFIYPARCNKCIDKIKHENKI